MDKKSYLQFCRYYKGEENNPYEGKDENKAMLWFYERAWVLEMQEVNADKKQVKDHISFTYVNEYLECGLAEFEQFDNIPITLKALLFNRYSHWVGRDTKGFKEWYKHEYVMAD